MDDHEGREPAVARNHEQQAGPVEPGAEAGLLEAPEGRQAGPLRRQGQLRGSYRNLKPYNRLSASRKYKRKVKLQTAVQMFKRSLPRDVKQLKVEMTLECGKEFTFREPKPDQLDEMMAQGSANINMMALAIKDRFGISDMAMHYLHMLKQPIPAKSQLVKERASLNSTLPIQVGKLDN